MFSRSKGHNRSHSKSSFPRQITPLKLRWRKHRRSKSSDDADPTKPNLAAAAAATGENAKDIARFSRSDIQVGKLLGEGGFAQVYEVLRCCALTSTTSGEGRHHHHHKNTTKYAIKYLRKDLIWASASESSADKNNRELFQKAADSLMQEARIMSQLNHPNILALRGLSHDSDQMPLPHSRSIDQFFLVTDRLQETLTDRLRRWKSSPTSRPAAALLHLKLQYALQIAKALNYLHDKRIIHRDCTTSNIGFCNDDTVQLFDFGLSRELPGSSTDNDVDDDEFDSDCDTVSSSVDEGNEVYHMTICGTQRFMAPETFSGQYNSKVDCYSWAMTVVELMTEKKPYSYMTLPVHKILVLEQGARPRLDDDAMFSSSGGAAGLLPILKGAWEEDIGQRWDMQQICDALEKYILLVAPGTAAATVTNKQLDEHVAQAPLALSATTNTTTASAA